MDLSPNPALESFRTDVREVFESEYPQDFRAKVATGASLTTAELRKSEMALGIKGWLASAWPTEFGGMNEKHEKLTPSACLVCWMREYEVHS